MQASNFDGTFDQLFLYEIFTEDASLLFLCHGAKKSKMTKKSNQGGGSCLKLSRTGEAHQTQHGRGRCEEAADGSCPYCMGSLVAAPEF